MTAPVLLRIKAQKPLEMDILSALVQDSLLPKTAFAYDKKERRAHLLVNRFCWEHAVQQENTDSSEPYYRVHAGLYFTDIEQVSVNAAFRCYPTEKVLNLLTVHADGKQEVNILFSEGAHICLKTQKCCAYLKDLHEGWPTTAKPAHP
ncbi:MAG: DUF2948 family protein [Holosporales bacterium]|jgi:hypothetical protein|nr:DUF2948 family protein [Holosporales bacterium]